MSKNKAHPAFYIFFHMGFKPSDLVKQGYKKPNVYNYYRKYNRVVKAELAGLLKGLQLNT